MTSSEAILFKVVLEKNGLLSPHHCHTGKESLVEITSSDAMLIGIALEKNALLSPHVAVTPVKKA